MPFRKDLVGDIRTNHWHGGIIATILDSVGGAIGIANFNSPEDKLSTIDLRVDYLRFANGNDLVFEGKLVRMGNRIMVTISMNLFQDLLLVDLVESGIGIKLSKVKVPFWLFFNRYQIQSVL